ncbi:MAG: hypothetical protein ABUK17_07405, partial [Syntrophobacteria bacterium]
STTGAGPLVLVVGGTIGGAHPSARPVDELRSSRSEQKAPGVYGGVMRRQSDMSCDNFLPVLTWEWNLLEAL